MSEFIDANLPILIERGVPPQLAIDAINLLDAQNRGELPCPLEGEELNIVRSAWTWMNANQHSQSTEE
jgi:hypothetical protein